jgi:uncharacterized repeat protein (TIGR03806 family)
LPYTVERTFAKHVWTAPIYVAPEPGTDQLWVVQAAGEAGQSSQIVRIADDPDSAETEVLLTLPGQLTYSVCFHPKYAENGFVFVFNNGPRDVPKRTNRVSRYTVAREPPRLIDPDSEEVILEWASAGHDGGDMTFGRDGSFYITTGDGTGDSDGWNSGQTLDDLLGSVLRIDVDRRDGERPYSVPADNPFVSLPGARPEIWAYGLRNPWRICTDARTGQIWVGNNGQDLWETAYLLERGANYGWSVYEGSHPFYPDRKRGPTPIVPPTIEHSHAEFRSLTGGVVYDGTRYPELEGAYIYGDYSSGRIWAMKHDGRRVVWHRELADTPLQIVSFRVDQRGDLLVTDNGGGLYRLVRAPKVEHAAPFPTRLSATGLFASTRDHRAEVALVPYALNAPGWNDGASGEHYLAVPGPNTVGFDANRGWNFADGSALVQTLSVERVPGHPESRHRVETRILVRTQAEWAGYSYRWDDDQADATLVDRGGASMMLALSGSVHRASDKTWRFPSRSECMMCHSRAANFVLGVTGLQLNRDHPSGERSVNQLQSLERMGLFQGALPPGLDQLERLAEPANETRSLEDRVRAYLHVNCAGCHVEAGGGNSQMQLDWTAPRDRMRLVSARPQHDSFGLDDAMLVAPGAPDRSVLLHRLSRRGPGQMPPLASNRVDDAALRLFRDWIAQLPPDRPFVRAWRMEDILPRFEPGAPGRSIERGRQVFRDIGCAQCHRFAGEGGTVGPDLTGVARRLAPKDLLESILEPSKVIADEFANHVVATRDGTIHTGRIEREDEQVLVLRSSSLDQAVLIRQVEIVERRRSDQSNMPAGIVNVLELEQILDLLTALTSEAPPVGPTP